MGKDTDVVKHCPHRPFCFGNPSIAYRTGQVKKITAEMCFFFEKRNNDETMRNEQALRKICEKSLISPKKEKKY